MDEIAYDDDEDRKAFHEDNAKTRKQITELRKSVHIKETESVPYVLQKFEEAPIVSQKIEEAPNVSQKFEEVEEEVENAIPDAPEPVAQTLPYVPPPAVVPTPKQSVPLPYVYNSGQYGFPAHRVMSKLRMYNLYKNKTYGKEFHVDCIILIVPQPVPVYVPPPVVPVYVPPPTTLPAYIPTPAPVPAYITPATYVPKKYVPYLS